MPIEGAPESAPQKPTSLRGLRALAMSKVEPTDKLLPALRDEEVDKAFEELQPASIKIDNRVIESGLDRLPVKDKEKDLRLAKAREQDIRHQELLERQQKERNEDEAYIAVLRAKMGLANKVEQGIAKRTRLAVTPEELEILREQAETAEALRRQAQEQLQRGGNLNEEIQGASSRPSSASFPELPSQPPQQEEQSTGMFRLDDLEKADKQSKRPPTAA